MSEALLVARNLCKSYSNEGHMEHVLRNIDVEIRSGDFTVIMGASGAGKSTLLYALSGMEKPSLGTVTLEGAVLTDRTPDQLAVFRRTHCGFVFQQPHLVQSMSILDNILCAAYLVQKNRAAAVSRAKELLEAVDMPEDTWERFPGQISGGQAQRVGIVRALINHPPVLFADEPTGALNSKAGRDVLDLLTGFHRSGQSIVMVTHDMQCARRANRILYLKDGAICGECELSPYEPGNEERHGEIRRFLSEMGW